MKKVVMAVVIATTMFAAFNANAQTSHLDKKFAFGVKGGLNLSNVSNFEDRLGSLSVLGIDMSPKLKFGFHAGVIGEYRLNRLLGVSAEVMYSMQGFKMGDELSMLGHTAEYDGKVTSNFVNVPLMLKFYPFGGLFIEVGPEADFCIGAKSVMVFKNDGEELIRDETDLKSGDDYNMFSLGLGIGAGWDFGHFFVNARYTLGLTPWIDREDDNTLNIHYDPVKNNNIQIGIGFKF